MRPIPPPKRNEEHGRGGPEPGMIRSVGPTMTGMARAAATLVLLTAGSLLLLIPAVFFVIPMPAEADALTLCLPGVGPLQRFRDGLDGERLELVFIHERVHAEQCRTFGPTWYARRMISPSGRLALEAQALCAEVALLSGRGADRVRLTDRTVEMLVSGYVERGSVPRGQISASVDRACGASMGD